MGQDTITLRTRTTPCHDDAETVEVDAYFLDGDDDHLVAIHNTIDGSGHWVITDVTTGLAYTWQTSSRTATVDRLKAIVRAVSGEDEDPFRFLADTAQLFSRGHKARTEEERARVHTMFNAIRDTRQE